MTVMRSLVFNIFYVTWTLILGILYLPLLAGPRRPIQRGCRFWLAGLRAMAQRIAGVRCRIEGLENLPKGPLIVAAKHQSAYDTFLFHSLLDDPVYVLKRELFRIPLVGWYMQVAGMVGIDRSAGAQALRGMMKGCGDALAEGRQIVIFPEGTRVSPGESRPYHPGVAALYTRFPDVPVVPVALNSGLLWGRKAFWKEPGTITVRVLPPVPAGLDRKAFLATLRTQVEGACAALPSPTA
ncbi:1-acyl-sn-glycerol-3-phosphate acyltransferase [Roseospira marina]|uniref:1-acyl-sn-glycerol-3-phosphate acyltransferase n=1 Tax=Roseospira marina TaxID=140057 RepID=A0A5M6I8C0_9PROT|nr:lysophospholipid acyltransferase family protein [Roseospira marina]KAA5604496.1 1-acyl-sn-glycerol-3-phosphate acyltransferase [Roseospira marina]MBB4315549.1 1-acyl-sn-glycerol-3-phosphate acyltransferase [Roseospira marina]MBB5088514.1 1-acyl-sn-glycerol-3-phosphate acyltransferase [Roseospira marina]